MATTSQLYGWTHPGSMPTTPTTGPTGYSAPVTRAINAQPWDAPIGGGTSGGVGTVGGSATGVGGYSPGAAPNLSSLTDMINQLNLKAQQTANAGRIPGGAGLEAQSSGNIGSLLSGNIPADVVRNLTQSAAERGIAMGSPGSDNSNSALLRSLGLTSLDLQGEGQKYLSAADARNPGAPIFDPTSQLLTPYQAGNLNNQNARLQLEWWNALHGGGGGRTGGGGGGGHTVGDTSALPSWFSGLTGGTPSPQAPVSMPGGTGTTTTSTLGGSSYTPTGQDWTGLFGDPFAQSPIPLDPGGELSGGAPFGTIDNGSSSTYDPFAQYGAPFGG